MSQERWKYWVGDDGIARIRQEDVPCKYRIEHIPMTASFSGRKFTGFKLKMNPDFYEFKAEIVRVTGKKDIIVVEN